MMADNKKKADGQTLDKKDKDGNSPLHFASKGGHTEVVQMLVDLGSSVSETNNSGETALHLATKEGHEGVVKCLLTAGADPDMEDNSGSTPMHIAAACGYASLVSLYAERKESEERKNTERASIKKGNEKTGNEELAVTESNENYEAGWTVWSNESKVFKSNEVTGQDRGVDSAHSCNSDSEDGFDTININPIHFFLRNRGLNFNNLRFVAERFEMMLNTRIGHDVLNEVSRGRVDVNARNENGFTPLHLAARFGAEEAVRKFLKKRADVNAKSDEGVTPISMAAVSGSVRILKMLFRAGADVTISDDEGMTPLHVAAYFGEVSAVKYLLSLGLDPNERRLDGETALHQAAKRGRLEVAVALLEGGAKKDIADNLGIKPVVYALHNADYPLIRMLLLM